MPQVPNYGDPSVMPNIPAQGRFDPIGDAGGQIAAQQLQQFGQATQEAGEGLGGIATDMQRRVDEVRVAAARNSALEAQQDLTYGQDGFLSQRGAQALNRPNGQALPDEYTSKLQAKLSDISSTLGSPAQQRQFYRESEGMLANFRGGVEQHMLSEFRSYQGSTWDGQVTLAHNSAIKAWNDPNAVAQSLGLIQQGIYQKSQLLGLSGNETQAAMDDAVSGVHRGVIEAALENNNPSYAMQYYDHNKDSMTPGDALAVQGVVNHQMDGQAATSAVRAATQAYASQFAPTDLDRLTGIVRGIESGGKDTNADGTPVTSSKGALYGMQVTPATAANPGFGIAPAKDDSAAEYNRVGQQYLGSLVKKYGNTAQALAAYNAGPDAVDAAIKGAQDGNWLSQLPKETQDYVQKGLSQFQTGGGAPSLPTKTQFVQSAIDQLGDNPRPEQLAMTSAGAERQYQLLIDSRKEQGEQALGKAQQALIASGGDFANLDPQLKADLARFDPDQYDNALKYAKAIARGDNTVTNFPAYAAAVTYPNELAKMSDTQFEQFAKTNLSPADAERIAGIRAAMINGKAANAPGSLNMSNINLVVNNRLGSIGINPTPKKTDLPDLQRVGSIKKFIIDDLYGQQAQLGRKLTQDEISQRVDELFAKSIEVKGRLWGTNDYKMLAMYAGNIPSDVAQAMRASFAAHGVKNPTNDQLLQAYWRRNKPDATEGQVDAAGNPVTPDAPPLGVLGRVFRDINNPAAIFEHDDNNDEDDTNIEEQEDMD